MRKVMRKVKSQWAVMGIMGAIVVALGTANVPGVLAEEVDGQTVTETSDTNAGDATTYDSASIKEATVIEVSDPSAISNPYNFYDWYESMGVDSYSNGMRFYIDGIESTFQLYVKIASDTGDLYLTVTQRGATEAEDVVLIENQIIKSNTNYSFVEEQDIEPVYFSFRNINADNYVEPNYNRFEEVTDESVDPLNIKIYRTEPFENAHKSEGLHFYESEGHLVGEAVIFVDMLGSYAPSAGGEVKYETVYKFVDINNETEYFKVVNDTSTTDSNFSQIISETVVDYPATVGVKDNAINTQPWNVEGWQNIGNSSDILNQTVDVTKEQVTDYGVTWALISKDGKELGWISKGALTTKNYAQIVSEISVDYPATISRGTDAINTAPWGARGFQTISSSADHFGKTVEVIKEQTMDYGVTWAQISLNGEVLGWIAKDALTVQNYAQITKETTADYPATINRGTDAINTAPWGAKGYQTIASSEAYVGKTVEVTKEQTTDYGVTWALISLDGTELGWIAKNALKVQTFAQITEETVVEYPATIRRDSDAINTAPWGVKGYQTITNSAAYMGQAVDVIKEQMTDYGVTWAQISINDEILGWIAKDALKIQTYSQIISEKEVDYPALIIRNTDAINTTPWGTKGFQTIASSADYLGKIVDVTREKVTDYGVTWVEISLNGEVLGWIAKDALKIQTYAQVISETVVDYPARISRGTDAINTAPWGTKGYETIASSNDYLGQTVKATKERITDYGVTWSLVSLNGQELGWIAKDALAVLDNVAPVITLNGDYEITMEVGAAYEELGAVVMDNADSNLEYIVENAVNPNVIGIYTVTYTAMDSAGNAKTEVRIVNVVDTTAPTISINGDTTTTMEYGEAYIEPGATAIDNVDAQVEVNVSGTVDSNTVGEYQISYSATDSNGNTSTATRIVLVKDTLGPVVTLLGDETIFVEYGEEFNEPGASATDNADGALEISVIGTVNTSVVGEYPITYSATDVSGNTVTVTRLVKVVDSIGPQITLIGEETITLQDKGTYEEFGATAVDNADGTLVVSVDGEVDTSVTGIYYVTYRAVDHSGNESSVTRKVIINPVNVTSVELDFSELVLTVGNKNILTAQIYPLNATTKDVIWTSSDETIATVDENGEVTAVKAGNVIITVTTVDGNMTATTSLTVRDPFITSIQELSPASITQHDVYALPDSILATMSNNTTKQVEVVWDNAVVDTTQIGTFTFYGTVAGYDEKISLVVNVAKYEPNLQVNNYSAVTINTLSKMLSLNINNMGMKPISITRIEIYEQGRYFTAYNASSLTNSGIPTTVLPYEQWGMSITFKLGIWLDNSYVKYYYVANGENYEHTEYLD